MPPLKKKWRQPVEISAPSVPAVPFTPPTFLSVEQAATDFGVTTWTIRRLISAGRLKAKRFGKRFTIKRADLHALWESEKEVAA